MAVSANDVTESVVMGNRALDFLRERFGVDGHRLMEAMASSLAIAQGRQSDLDIRQTRGAARYNAVGVGAREVFLPAGYSLLAALPRILRSEEGPVEVALYFGDENTGLPDVSPTNAYAKGESMDELVATNQGQLFPDMPLSFRPGKRLRTIEQDSGAAVWVLLVRPQGRQLRAEFSLPCGSNSLGFICEWSERLLLPEVEIQRGESETWAEEPSTLGVAIDVPVKPR